MSQSDWPPRSSIIITSPPLLPFRSFGILSHQTTYMLILRTVYINPHRQLLQVFNALFFPASGPTPVQMTLNEWHKMWSVQTLYVRNLPSMQRRLEYLSCRHDWVCYGTARAADGAADGVGGIPPRPCSTKCGWDDVLGFIKRMAEEVGTSGRPRAGAARALLGVLVEELCEYDPPISASPPPPLFSESPSSACNIRHLLRLLDQPWPPAPLLLRVFRRPFSILGGRGYLVSSVPGALQEMYPRMLGRSCTRLQPANQPTTSISWPRTIYFPAKEDPNPLFQTPIRFHHEYHGDLRVSVCASSYNRQSEVSAFPAYDKPAEGI
ncbi:MAG: hypothetical protein Q9191_002628 [Dirinaria sp. TL-2023a]